MEFLIEGVHEARSVSRMPFSFYTNYKQVLLDDRALGEGREVV